MNSILLYMSRTRVTFRVDPELARQLRRLPNQTRFVEEALMCGGSGCVADGSLRVSDFRIADLPRLERDAATQLKGLVRFGRRTFATDLELESQPGEDELRFRIARDETTLLSGRLSPTDGALHLN
jgi:hypothetical protein